MNKLPLILLCLLGFRIGFSQSWQEALNDGDSTINLHWYISKPFIFTDQNGEMTGLEVEIIDLFRQYVKQHHQVNLHLNWLESESFSGIIDTISHLKSENHLGVSAFSITDDRKKVVDYSQPYMPDITVLISSQGTPVVDSFEKIDDLMKEMVAITIKGTVYEKQLLRLKEKLGINFDIKYIDSDANVLDHISKTGNSFGFIDLPIYLIWLKNGESLVRQNYFTVYGTGYGIIFSKNSDWVEPFNEFLGDPEVKIQISKIISNYISPELYEFINGLYESDLLGTTLLTKEKEIQQTLIENARLKLEQERSFTSYLVIGFVITLVFSVVIAVFFLKIRKTNQLLKKQQEKIAIQRADIEEKHGQLLNRNARLLALNEENTYLVRILAHDLRTPLTSIMGLSGVIKKDASRQPEEIKEFAKTINDSAHRMSMMIDKILKKDDLDEYGHQILKEKVPINKLVEDVKFRFIKTADSKNIKINLGLSDYEITMDTDLLILQLVLENLLSNAIKFSPPSTEVYITTQEENDSNIISVSDEGPGFSEEDKSKMYHRFTTLTAQPTGGEESIGLGLSIVKRYVGLLGGTISLDSSEGKGSTFHIIFPK